MSTEQDNLHAHKLSMPELLAEYERATFALAWALKRLGGPLTIPYDAIEGDKGNLYRVWYGSDDAAQAYTIELRPHNYAEEAGTTGASPENVD